MVLRDIPGWPPRWSGDHRGGLEFPQGEIGTLRAAVADADHQVLVLAIELDGDNATGVLPLPPSLLAPLAQLLRECPGMPLATVGGLEVAVAG
ncbi:MAG: hypothetical protein ACREK7_10600 [Gemmatimonadota bacterium]